MKFSNTAQYLISIFGIFAVAAVGYLAQDIFGYRGVALMLLLAVSVLAMLFKIRPVLLAAVMSALIWDYFFIPPRFTLTVHSAEDLLLLIMYFAIALVNAVLTFKIREIEKDTQKKEEREKSIVLYNTLLNSLSHELRTPIATIIGATDTLKDEAVKLNENNKSDLVEEISKASLRLDRQVGNLLNMSRLQSGFIQPRFDWCDLTDLLHSVVNKIEKDHDLSKTMGRRKINIHIKSGFPLLKLDSGLMEQALYNILNNAVLYTPPDATVEVLASVSDDIVEESSTGVGHLVHYLVVKISDNGPGFPEEEIGKVFERFYRLKNSKTGGTGLGLSIAKGFVEAHKGKIALTNNKNEGAEFTITIPVEISDLKP